MPRPPSIARLIVAAALMPAAAAHGQVPFRFDDVSAQRGIGSYRMAAGMGAGVAAADYDGDRDIDLFVPTAEGEADQLYQNIGNGKFVEVAADVGLDSTTRSRTALWLDYDGDGDLDLLVATDHDWMTTGPYTLYRQDDGVFTDVTAGSGLDVPAPVREDHPIIPHRGGLCAGDINGDGHLDVYSLQWNGLPHLFLSNRDGTFHDITSSSGVDTALYYAHQPMMHDFDRDGWTDIYAAIDFLHNALYINQRNGTFVDVAAAAGADNAMNDMGMSLGDVDNDGGLRVRRVVAGVARRRRRLGLGVHVLRRRQRRLARHRRHQRVVDAHVRRRHVADVLEPDGDGREAR
jgi:hypothetical protein